jgi:hypothetical protein
MSGFACGGVGKFSHTYIAAKVAIAQKAEPISTRQGRRRIEF